MSDLNLKGKIYEANIAEKAMDYALLFGGNRNIFRHVSSVVDGLKPVERRVLFNLFENYPRDVFEKVQDVTGTTMGKYHPHGDSSIVGVIGKMANPRTNNIPFLAGHGNFGSINGDDQGAARYIECKLSKFGYYCFFKDFDKNMVDMRETYTGKGLEPDTLPSRYPSVFINGSFSNMGIGLASNIPPYNFKEICEATIKLIKNPNAKIYLIPDSPTGCDVLDDKSVKEGFKHGIGKVTFQATYDIDYYANTITITSIPPVVKLKNLQTEVSMMKQAGKLPDLKDHVNRSSKVNGMKYILFFGPNANLDENLEKLMKSKIGLRVTKPIGIVLIDNYQDHDYSFSGAILGWLEYRREFIRAYFNGKLVQKLEEKHMNDVKLMVFDKDNLAQTLKLAKSSANRQEYMDRLMKTYGISSLQADVISKMRTCDFNKDALEGYRKSNVELKKEIEELERDIDDPESIDRTIIEQLQEGIKLFGEPRRSRIISSNGTDINQEFVIGVSEDGFVKKVDGGLNIGRISKNPGQTNMVNIAKTKDVLMVFDSSGKINRLKVEDIPNSKPTSHGIAITKFTKISGKIVAIIKVPKKSEEDLKACQLIIVSSKGNVKKISMDAFLKSKTELLVTSTDEGNELVIVLGAMENTSKDIILYTNFGDGIRLSISSLKTFGRAAKGSSVVKLRPGEEIVGASKIIPEKDYLFYLTSSGKAKLTKLEYFPVMDKKDVPLALISLGQKETLVGIASVNENDVVKIYRKENDPVEIEIGKVKVTTRVAKAEKVVKTPSGDKVIGFEVL